MEPTSHLYTCNYRSHQRSKGQRIATCSRQVSPLLDDWATLFVSPSFLLDKSVSVEAFLASEWPGVACRSFFFSLSSAISFRILACSWNSFQDINISFQIIQIELTRCLDIWLDVLDQRQFRICITYRELY